MENLFQLVYEFFHWSISWIFPAMEMIRADQRGVLVRGARVREIGPGYVWFWRNWTTCYVEVVARKVVEMMDQPLTTEDDCTVRVGGVLVYRVTDVTRWIIDNEDPEHGLMVEAQRVIRDHVLAHTFEEIQALTDLDEDDEEDLLTTSARRDLQDAFGVRVHRLGLTAFAEARVMDLNHTGSAVTVELKR